MVFVRLPVLDFMKRPMDRGLVCRDGKRLFGANKTWKGFFGMIFLTALWMWIFGLIDSTFSRVHGISLFRYEDFSTAEEWLYGAIWGFGYVLFELPNSFIKRRIGIPPGKNRAGLMGNLFKFIDQADSVLGCMILMLIFYVPSISDAAAIFIIGVAIHYLINILLYMAGLKQQAG